MALSNAQYESIMKGYQTRQNANHQLWLKRRDAVYELVPGYLELEDAMHSASLKHTRLLLAGEDTRALRQELSRLSVRKENLLSDAGYPKDYLKPVYDCCDCQDTGYLSAKEESKREQYGVKCHCFRQQEITLLYEQSNIQRVIEQENFHTLSFTYYQGEDLTRFQDAVKAAKDFVQNFKTEYQNLFFYGTVGTGKSFLSGCIARELLQSGHPVIYFSSAGLFDTLAKYSFDNKSKETLYNFYEDLYNCDLVIVDDLGTELTNLFVNSQLFAFLNERHIRRKATIISTNLSLEDLPVRYSDRIFSRITSNYQLFKLSGPDIRMYKKRIANKKK